MSNENLNFIFEQIDNLKRPALDILVEVKDENAALSELLNQISVEIQRIMDENHFTQEELCRITKMSQSNLSRIQNGKVVPRIETLQRIAVATNTKLVISFEGKEDDA